MSDSDGSKNIRRRDFLDVAIGGSATALTLAAGYPAARFIEPPAGRTSGSAVVGKLDELPVGTAKTVLVDERPVLIVRTVDGEVRAFSALCPHLQCVVGYSAEHNRIECPCHGGVFSVDGRNVAGPPTRPLDELKVSLNEGLIVVWTAA